MPDENGVAMLRDVRTPVLKQLIGVDTAYIYRCEPSRGSRVPSALVGNNVRVHHVDGSPPGRGRPG